jgi:hypothetical protein
MPSGVKRWIASRFDKQELIVEDGAAFDMVRAAVNLVLSGMLIIMGTNLKLPLSTTYVTFMVAMGSSLADRAWGRESAVFRVTGVLSVIGGWFITAGVAFMACALVSLLMYLGGYAVMFLFIVLDIYLLIRSNRKYNQKVKSEQKDSTFRIMMRSRDPEIVWDLLRKHVGRTQAFVSDFSLKQYENVIEGLENQNLKLLRRAHKELKEEGDILKKYRKREFLALRRAPLDMAIERNTWFHLGANSNQQYIYCLRRMLDPIMEHVDNNFSPISEEYISDYLPVRRTIEELMKATSDMISTGRFGRYDEVLNTADSCKDELSVIRKRQLDRMQKSKSAGGLQMALVYLNVLQESQEFLSIMRHQLRAAYKFLE